tara:strand:- start:292 stop:438 length:147 start_codon:yes stop_codon:yes gene_type:complete
MALNSKNAIDYKRIAQGKAKPKLTRRGLALISHTWREIQNAFQKFDLG